MAGKVEDVVFPAPKFGSESGEWRTARCLGKLLGFGSVKVEAARNGRRVEGRDGVSSECAMPLQGTMVLSDQGNGVSVEVAAETKSVLQDLPLFEWSPARRRWGG